MRQAAKISDSGFSMLHQFSAHNEDDRFEAVTVHYPSTLAKKTFRQLHEAILDTFLTER